jgi:hypothetical protein
MAAVPAAAQLVSIRTAPVSVSEQFRVYPSELKGMGGGLALQDHELDPFNNPAAASRIGGWLLAATPSLYSIPDDDGFGRSLPVTVFGSGEHVFGGASIAVQELESAFRQVWWGPWIMRDDRLDGRFGERFATNVYSLGMLGRRWPERRLSLAASASYARLDKVHAVDLLYPQSIGIEQGGHISDLRLGLVKELEQDSYLEAVVLRNKVDVAHTVTYLDLVFDPITGGPMQTEPRRELNQDHTTTWGAHAKYVGATSPTHWRWAAALSANAKSHPKIPNYEFMSIPRDPGDSYAFRLDVGAARQTATSRLALDFAYEPIWTSTWAEAAEDITTERGTIIRSGEMTVENEFVFSNYALHVGYGHRWDELGIQLGIAGRNVSYFLDQYNAITNVQREQDESWWEVAPTWGITFAFSAFELRYFGQHRGGELEFGGSQPVFRAGAEMDAGGPDIVAAPSGPLSMDVTRVLSHELGISLPLGHRRH